MEGPKADTQVATGASEYASEGQPTARVGAGGGPAQPKLRGSCHSCATSKVKCPKEKPTCSRCKARGVACQYFLTRRPGRRREGSISRVTNGDANTSTSNKTAKSSRDRRTSAHSQGQRPRASNLGLSPSSERRKDGSAGLSDDGMEEDNHDTIQVVPRLSVDVPFSAATAASPTAGSVAGANNYLGTPMSISTYPEFEHMSAIEQGDQYRDQYPDLEDNAVFSVSDMMLLEHDLDNFDFVLPDLDPVSLEPVSFKMPSLAGSAGSGHLHNDTASILMQAPAARSSLDLILPRSAPPAEHFSYSTSSTGSSLAASIHGSVLDKGKGMAASILGGGRACGCLEEALGLLRMLSSSTTEDSSRSSVSSSGHPVLGAPADAQDTVLRENQQTIDAISGMISCQACAEDTFFLTVVSMIILKTLRRYAAAARPSCASGQGQPEKRDDSHPQDGAADGVRAPHVKGARSASSILLSSQDQLWGLARRDDRGRDRASAQLVLGELHRVQRLVNQLSPKLKRNRDVAAGDGHGMGPDVDILRCGGGGGGGVVRGGAAVDVARGCVGSPEKIESTCFSANTLDQIERDVRWSLAGLSAEIIKRLRQD